MKKTLCILILTLSLSLCTVIPGIDTITGSAAKEKILKAANKIDRVSLSLLVGSSSPLIGSIVEGINRTVLPAVISINESKYYDKASVNDCADKINSLVGLILGGASTLPLCDIQEASFIDIGPIDIIEGNKAKVNNALAFILYFGTGDAGTGPNPTITSITNATTNSNSGNIPGSTIKISGTGFSSGTRVGISVPNSNTTYGATILSVTSTEITFTLPDILYTDNVTVDVIVTTSGNSNSARGTLKYFGLRSLGYTYYSLIRTHAGLGSENSHWYTVTLSSPATFIFNASGYTNSNLDFYLYSSPTSNSPLASATSGSLNVESLRTSALVVGTTYFFEVRLISGSASAYNLGVANGEISILGGIGGRCNQHTAISRCTQVYANDSTTQTNCTGGGGTYTASQTCSSLGLGTVVGRCTNPSSTNIATVYYYSNGGTPFSAGTANTACAGIADSIFQ
jgi:small lipoprotein (TIGR04452 family)